MRSLAIFATLMMLLSCGGNSLPSGTLPAPQKASVPPPDISGVWVGTYNRYNYYPSSLPVTFYLKQSQNDIHGTWKNIYGDLGDVTGKVSGENISLRIIPGGSGADTLAQGTAASSEITFKATTDEGYGHWSGSGTATLRKGDAIDSKTAKESSAMSSLAGKDILITFDGPSSTKARLFIASYNFAAQQISGYLVANTHTYVSTSVYGYFVGEHLYFQFSSACFPSSRTTNAIATITGDSINVDSEAFSCLDIPAGKGTVSIISKTDPVLQ